MTPNQYKAARRRLDELSRKEAVLSAKRDEALKVLRDTFGDVPSATVAVMLREKREALKERQAQFDKQVKEAESVVAQFYN